MPTLNLVEAVNDALHVAMAADERVVVLGEDVGRFGGVFRATDGLFEAFGEDRVVDTPLSEGGIVGTAIGMAMYGLRPVVEIQFADFIYPAFDQIVNELAKLRYRSAGQYTAPVVIRAPSGGGVKGGLYHSQSPEAHFVHTPGLRVVAPGTPRDAKGLLLSALEGEDPVLVLEPKRSYRAVKGEVPEGWSTVPLGVAEVVRPGEDLTVVAWGAMRPDALAACVACAEEGIDAELIDPRTLAPLDTRTLVESVARTGRLVVVHEAPRTAGLGAEILAQALEGAFFHLRSPPVRVCGPDTPFPYALEKTYLPSVERIVEGIRAAVREG